MRKPFSIKWIYLIEKRSFDQKYKFSNKNDMACAWRNFKNIFSTQLFTIIFRPKILSFVTYLILTGETKVEFLIYWVFLQNWFNPIMGRKWVFLVIMLLHAMNNIILSVFWPNHFTNAFATDRIFQDVAVASVAFSYFTFDKSTSADPFFALRCAGQILPRWHGHFHSGTLSSKMLTFKTTLFIIVKSIAMGYGCQHNR